MGSVDVHIAVGLMAKARVAIAANMVTSFDDVHDVTRVSQFAGTNGTVEPSTDDQDSLTHTGLP